MIPLLLTHTHTLSPSSPPSSFSLSSSSSSSSSSSRFKLKPTTTNGDHRTLNQAQHLLRGRGIVLCRAELSQEAPFAIAIGASMLNSLLFPYTAGDATSDDDEEEDNDAAITTTDARFAIMTVIGLIPYFNWLSWVFALMDTGKPRYAVYAAVYLAPYLRTNLSISPEESWLPIASIVLCVIHIQLEASIKSGDLDAFTFFNEAAKRIGLVAGSKDNHSRRQVKTKKVRRRDNKNLPSGQTHLRDEIRKWGMPRKPIQDLEHVNEDSDADDAMEH